MKKLVQFLSTSTVAMTMVVGVAAAGASSSTICSGSNSNTGAGSTNTVKCVDKNNTQVSCVNNLVVTNNNPQKAKSGGAFTVGNTQSGNAGSGDSDNNSTVTVTVGAACAPVATASTPKTPNAPAASMKPGGVGGGSPAVNAQVTAPAGGVHAGGGAGVATSSAEVVGLVGSALAIASGAVVAIRKHVLGL